MQQYQYIITNILFHWRIGHQSSFNFPKQKTLFKNKFGYLGPLVLHGKCVFFFFMKIGIIFFAWLCDLKGTAFLLRRRQDFLNSRMQLSLKAFPRHDMNINFYQSFYDRFLSAHPITLATIDRKINK